MSGGRLIALTAAAAVIVGLGIAIPLALRGDDGPAEAPPRSATSAAAGVAPAAPDPPALPEAVPGVRLEPVSLTTYRLSLVFRLRNTILNGLSGTASDYAVNTSQARIGGTAELLIGVAARPGAEPPGIPAAIAGLVGVNPVSRRRAAGLPISVFPAAGYQLALVNAGPRWAIVVIAEGRAQAERIAVAVARAVRRDRIAP